MASLSRVKNQRLLIDALPIVREKVDAHLDLVGEDTLSGELQKHAADSGVGAHVTFHGFLPQPGVLEILSRSDLYVQIVAARSGRRVGARSGSGRRAHARHAWRATSRTGRRRKRWRSATRLPSRSPTRSWRLHADPDRRRSMAALARGVLDRARRLVVGRAVRSVVSGLARLDRSRQRQVQAAHASPAGLIALDAK